VTRRRCRVHSSGAAIWGTAGMSAEARWAGGEEAMRDEQRWVLDVLREAKADSSGSLELQLHNEMVALACAIRVNQRKEGYQEVRLALTDVGARGLLLAS
jgi:hypothetical protein